MNRYSRILLIAAEVILGSPIFCLPVFSHLKNGFFRLVLNADINLSVGDSTFIIPIHASERSFIKIGSNVRVERNSLVDWSGELEMGSNVTISQGVFIYTHKHQFAAGKGVGEASATSMRIGSNVWIGARSIILPSVECIGDNVMIGAGSVVTKSVESGAVIVGNPAKNIKEITLS
ncbi:MAG: acyltransferase [Candidatus Micrarchaeota archaeon]|nr:acyltransferase [Candidatus Micrarchaeota archaeon]